MLGGGAPGCFAAQRWPANCRTPGPARLGCLPTVSDSSAVEQEINVGQGNDAAAGCRVKATSASNKVVINVSSSPDRTVLPC